MENELLISKPLAQAILNYLQAQPYMDVYQLVAELVQLKQVEPANTKPDTPAKP